VKKILFSFFLALFSFLFSNVYPVSADASLITNISVNQLSTRAVTVDSIHHRAYFGAAMADDSNGTLYVVDTITNSIISSIPFPVSGTIASGAMAVNSLTGKLYVANYSDHTITIFDANTLAILGTISDNFIHPNNITIDEQLNKIYITDINTCGYVICLPHTLTIVDGNTDTVVTDNISVGDHPSSIAINPNTNKVYVIASGEQPAMTILDRITNNVITTIPVIGTGSQSIEDIKIDTNLNKIYISHPFGGDVFVLDGNTNTVTTSIPVVRPVNCTQTLSINSQSHRLYSACDTGVFVVDTNTDQIIQFVSTYGQFPMIEALNDGTIGYDALLHKLFIPIYELHTVAVVSEGTNTPPSITPHLGGTINEGSTYTETGSFTDSDSTSWTGTVDYGDGTGSQTLNISGNNFTLSHVYKDNNPNPYTVTVSITDNQGATGNATAQVTVNNVAPTVGTITASINPIQVNTATTASAAFTDPGILDTHTASWNWGDSSNTTGTVTETNGSGSVSNSHTYAAVGVCTITLTVTDKDNGQSSQTYQYLTVYDPSAGWVTGGKDYTSPAGAVIQNPTVTGKASFGFTAKYANGNVVPIGNKWASVTFNAGNIDFSATSYQWLVVSGAKATLKGNGTLNGVSGYTVLISAIDGSQTGGNDLIRYQIKDSSGNVAYDTQPGAVDTADPTTIVTKGKINVH
jgi:hypothetical protein